MSAIDLDEQTTKIDSDPEHRPVRFIVFTCPCGLRISEFCVEGPAFTLPNFFADGRALNIWHIDINRENKTLSMTPSVDLSQIKPHQPTCHFFVNGPFEWVRWRTPPANLAKD